MESFNFGAFDPTIGARIAAIPQEAQKQQTANMLQAMQMQGVMNQNELAQSQMRTAKRAEEGQTLLGKAYGGLDFSGAGEGGVPGQSPFAAMKSQVIKSLTASNRPDLIPSELAKLTEMEHKANVNEELKGKLAEQARKAVDSELTSFTKNAFKVTDVPSLTTHLRAFYDNPLLGKIAARFKTFDQALNDDIKQISTPEGLRQWQAENANLTGKELTDLLLKVTTNTENLGDVSRTTQRGGMGQTIGVPVDTPMGMTPGQVRAAADAKLSREQSERHFQAGGYTYDLDRGIRIDRNGIATQLMQQAPPVGGAAVGGGVPSNAPVSGGIPTGRGSAAGLVPLGPKPEKLNESQGNATAFGLIMKESEAILERLANPETGKPTLRGANVEAIPFVGGAAGKMLPSFLGGTSEQQQQVNQAKTNFITAVLRKESGAAIGKDEYETEDKKYFPQLNDGPKVIQQKANARRLAIEAMKFQAGPGAKEIDKYVPNVNIETLPPNLSEPPPGAVRPRGSR